MTLLKKNLCVRIVSPWKTRKRKICFLLFPWNQIKQKFFYFLNENNGQGSMIFVFIVPFMAWDEKINWWNNQLGFLGISEGKPKILFYINFQQILFKNNFYWEYLFHYNRNSCNHILNKMHSDINMFNKYRKIGMVILR